MTDPVVPLPPTTPPAEATGPGLYAKAFAAAVVTGLTAYTVAVEDGTGVSRGEWITIFCAFLAAFGAVWAFPQTSARASKWGKALTAGVLAAGAVLVTGYTDGSLSTTEIITAVIAFLVSSGLTGVVPNAAASDPVINGHQVGVSEAAKESLLTPTLPSRAA